MRNRETFRCFFRFFTVVECLRVKMRLFIFKQSRQIWRPLSFHGHFTSPFVHTFIFLQQNHLALPRAAHSFNLLITGFIFLFCRVACEDGCSSASIITIVGKIRARMRLKELKQQLYGSGSGIGMAG